MDTSNENVYEKQVKRTEPYEPKVNIVKRLFVGRKVIKDYDNIIEGFEKIDITDQN